MIMEFCRRKRYPEIVRARGHGAGRGHFGKTEDLRRWQAAGNGLWRVGAGVGVCGEAVGQRDRPALAWSPDLLQKGSPELSYCGSCELSGITQC